MLAVTSNTIPCAEIERTLGIVRGSAIRTRHLLADFIEGIRNLVGAELPHYTKMIAETREQALDRMKEDARRMGANAVIAVRIEMSNVARGAAEVLAYGTAVIVSPDDPAS